jgi:uncharacterized membrane protein (UPF0127 family)
MNSRFVNVVNRKTGQVWLTSVRWCSSFWCRFVGYQFRRRLKPNEALILVYRKDSISATSIHMLFVFTPLTVVWINEQGTVTSVQLAQPWRPYYASPAPARYVLETTPELFELIHQGDEIDFI